MPNVFDPRPGHRVERRCWQAGSVYLYFDESGDFEFPGDRFDAYVQAALICPDSCLDEMNEAVERMRADLDVDELHGTELADDQLLAICQYLGQMPLALLAQATDTDMMTIAQIGEHRLAQAAQYKKSLDRWRAAGGDSEEMAADISRLIKRAGLPQQVNHSEYVQGDLMIDLIGEALQKSIVSYMQDEWRGDFVDYHVILDGKLPGKLAAGEKMLDDLVMPALSSPRFRLVSVTEWRKEPVHPFEEKFSDDDGSLSLNRLFEHGLQFESSEDHAGLQLVDIVAHVTRKAIVQPENEIAYRAYARMKDRLRRWDRDGQALRLVRYRTGQDNHDRDRYRRLV